MTATTVTVFKIHRQRTADAAHAILGRVRGVLVSDRHGAYNGWPGTKHQFCWAHLIRDFVKMVRKSDHRERPNRRIVNAQIGHREHAAA